MSSSVSHNGTMLGQTIDLKEACKGTAFLSCIHSASRFEDTRICIHALDTGLIIRVVQGVDPHRFVEITIPRNNNELVELITSEPAYAKPNQEIIK